MTVLHSGTTQKYSANWDQAFKKGKAAAGPKPANKAAKKASKSKPKAKR